MASKFAQKSSVRISEIIDNDMSEAKRVARSALDQLKNATTVVADTGDFEGLY